MERVEEVAQKQGIWQHFMHQILIGSPWGLGIGLLEQSGSPSLVVPWFDVSRLFRQPSLPGCSSAAILPYPTHPDIPTSLIG